MTVKNCTVRALGSAGSTLKGHGPAGIIRDVTFAGNRVLGVPADSLQALNVTQTNAFAENVAIKVDKPEGKP